MLLDVPTLPTLNSFWEEFVLLGIKILEEYSFRPVISEEIPTLIVSLTAAPIL